MPGVELVQVVQVIDEASIKQARQIAPYVDRLLLDSGFTSKSGIPQLGGTGRTHNWDISRQIVDQVKIPVLLAGGINEINVRTALQEVKPYGINLCTGLRSAGQLDEEKLKRFMAVITAARTENRERRI